MFLCGEFFALFYSVEVHKYEQPGDNTNVLKCILKLNDFCKHTCNSCSLQAHLCLVMPAGMLFGWEFFISFILVSTVYAVAIGEPTFGECQTSSRSGSLS